MEGGVVVGCLDTGIDSGHPALKGCIQQFRAFKPDGYSWDDGPPEDWSWHGTHVAGLIAGRLPSGEPLGAAPDARLICGGVIEQGAVVARILLGLDWLASHAISVANLSLGVAGETPVFRTMLRVLAEQDVLITAPIGNRGAGRACVPGIYSEVLSVGAVDSSVRVPRFSGSWNDPVTKACRKPDVVAPGVDRLSCVPGGGFLARSGTSMASAVVAGMAAALRGAFPQASARTVASALCQTALPLNPEQRHRARCGLARFGEAFRFLQEAPAESSLPLFESECFPRFVDQRLMDRFACALDTNEQDAILEFDDNGTCLAFKREIAQEGGGAERVVHLRHAPILIVRCPARLLRRILTSDLLRAASACDVNHQPFFR